MTTLTLYQGDCLEVMKEIPSKSVDLIICDLPYGCLRAQEQNVKRGVEGFQKGGKAMTACAWDIKIDLVAFWKEVKRIRKTDHSPTIHFATTKFGYEIIKSNEAEFRYDLVWDKQRGVSFLSANKMPMRSHEMIYVFSKAGAFYNRVDIKGDFKGWKDNGNDGSKRCALSVIKNSTSSTRGGHPTEKPQELYRWLIERYSPVGGTVLDPTFGSANSVFTAVEMGREGIGIEKDEAFFGKAEKRLLAL